MCKGPATRSLQCLRTGERSVRSQTEGHSARRVGGSSQGVSPFCVRCPHPPGFLPLEPRACSGLSGGAHGGAEGDGGRACAGNDVGTRGPGDTHWHTKSCVETLRDGGTAETQGLEQALCPQAPPSAHTSRQADPLSPLPLSLALQQSSCSKLIEFSAWEGPGELRRVGAGKELVNRSGLPPHPGSPPLRWGWGGQALVAWEQWTDGQDAPPTPGRASGDERRPGLRAGCSVALCTPLSTRRHREWDAVSMVDARLSLGSREPSSPPRWGD